jgi:peptide/nickel transport system permease protein
MRLARFVLRRLLFAIPILLGIVFFTFMLVRIGTRDASIMLAGPMAEPAQIAAIAAEFGLDRPLWEQFAIYLGKLVTGDLGRSWLSKAPILEEILHRLPATLELLVSAMTIGALIGIPVGLRAAARPDGTFDQVSRIVSLLGFSIPTYWLGLMLIFVFYLKLGWAPAPMGRLPIAEFPPATVTGSIAIDALLAGDRGAARGALHQLMLPVLIFAAIIAAPIVKQTRAIAIEVLSGEAVRFARASGLAPRTVRRIVLRNSIVPILTFIGSELTAMLAAVSLLELIFAWGGLGQWGLHAILVGDFAAVQGYVLVLALFSILVFLVVDAAVLLLEPRSQA